MHHYESLSTRNPSETESRFLALWQQIAEHYHGYPPELVLELLNEPEANLTSEKWNAFLAEAIKIVRQSNPTRQIVVGPISWNGIKGPAQPGVAEG